MWHNVWAVIRREYLQRVRSKRFVISTVSVPAMMIAMIILVLAWSLSTITENLNTAGYLVSILGDTLHPGVVPALIFVLSAATAFATGSSWGTMGILMPLVIPLTWAVMQSAGLADAGHYSILYSAVSCVLAGAVWGDHCSPISDTTVLASVGADCDHLNHVWTQAAYAAITGLVTVFAFWLGGIYEAHWVLVVAAAVLLVIMSAMMRTIGVPEAGQE